jgi:hypothetical protein
MGTFPGVFCYYVIRALRAIIKTPLMEARKKNLSPEKLVLCVRSVFSKLQQQSLALGNNFAKKRTRNWQSIFRK